MVQRQKAREDDAGGDRRERGAAAEADFFSVEEELAARGGGDRRVPPTAVPPHSSGVQVHRCSLCGLTIASTLPQDAVKTRRVGGIGRIPLPSFLRGDRPEYNRHTPTSSESNRRSAFPPPLTSTPTPNAHSVRGRESVDDCLH